MSFDLRCFSWRPLKYLRFRHYITTHIVLPEKNATVQPEEKLV